MHCQYQSSLFIHVVMSTPKLGDAILSMESKAVKFPVERPLSLRLGARELCDKVIAAAVCQVAEPRLIRQKRRKLAKGVQHFYSGEKGECTIKMMMMTADDNDR